MIPELGHYALVLALAIALVQSIVPLYGAQRNDAVLMGVAEPTALAQFGFIAFAFAALVACYVTSDFSVATVFENSHSAMPLIYKFTSVWGNHEGSMLLWVLILTVFGALVAAFGRNIPATLKATVLSVQSWVATAFYLFILVTSNPFARIADAPFEGRDLNPILQDIGLAVHPPMLYLGYVGFSITFSFAIAASTPPGRAGCGRGRSRRGPALRSASRWARSGPTTRSAGAAGGTGTQWRTHRSCRGSPAPRCCTRRW
jgi:cytochrome c-type biogenesis protein CcmF